MSLRYRGLINVTREDGGKNILQRDINPTSNKNREIEGIDHKSLYGIMWDNFPDKHKADIPI